MKTDAHAKAEEGFNRRAATLGLRDLPRTLFEEVYVPLADWVAERKAAKNAPYFLGVNGAQGSGKSTFCELIRPVLQHLHGLQSGVLSVDDVYHTRRTRQELAHRIHPLCAIRGVPGTHDLQLANEVFDQVLAADGNGVVRLPRFDKASDDRKAVDDWEIVREPLDVLLFEGWCVGCPPLPAWERPYNEREERDDPEGIWARWSQECLKTAYQALFARLDALVMIKVPSMETVRQSRWLQEEKLWQAHEGKAEKPVGLMTRDEVWDYVALFERHTEFMLDRLAARADRLVVRDHDFHYQLVTSQAAPHE